MVWLSTMHARGMPFRVALNRIFNCRRRAWHDGVESCPGDRQIGKGCIDEPTYRIAEKLNPSKVYEGMKINKTFRSYSAFPFLLCTTKLISQLQSEDLYTSDTSALFRGGLTLTVYASKIIVLL